MKNSGKLVVFWLVALAVCAAVGAVWFQYRATHRALGMWGVEGARLIRSGSQVRVLRLDQPDNGGPLDLPAIWAHAAANVWNSESPPAATNREGASPGSPLTVIDLTDVPGLLHLRTALLIDESFLWDAETVRDQPRWDFALAFSDGSRVKVLVVSLQSGCIWDLRMPAPVAMSKKLTDGMDDLLRPYLDGDA